MLYLPSATSSDLKLCLSSSLLDVHILPAQIRPPSLESASRTRSLSCTHPLSHNNDLLKAFTYCEEFSCAHTVWDLPDYQLQVCLSSQIVRRFLPSHPLPVERTPILIPSCCHLSPQAVKSLRETNCACPLDFIRFVFELCNETPIQKHLSLSVFTPNGHKWQWLTQTSCEHKDNVLTKSARLRRENGWAKHRFTTSTTRRWALLLWRIVGIDISSEISRADCKSQCFQPISIIIAGCGFGTTLLLNCLLTVCGFLPGTLTDSFRNVCNCLL